MNLLVQSAAETTSATTLAGVGRELRDQSKAENTRTAYRSGWRDFRAYAERVAYPVRLQDVTAAGRAGPDRTGTYAICSSRSVASNRPASPR